MNLNEQLLKHYIDLYIQHFHYIHHQEENKWRAVKTFQENWDLNAPNLSIMLSQSVKDVGKLLTSTNFYPLNNLHEFANIDPNGFRITFKNLIEHSGDTSSRIVQFRQECTRFLQTLDDPKKQYNYNGYRSAMVFLTLNNPNDHFLYKFEMYKLFCALFDLPQPKKGKPENIANYENLCFQIRTYLRQNKRLVHLHKSVLGPNHYQDVSLNIRTQDFFYACTYHLLRISGGSSTNLKYGLSDADISTVDFKTRKKIYSQKSGLVEKNKEREAEDKAIGTYGEKLVYEYLKTKHPSPDKVIPYFETDDFNGYDIAVESNGTEIKRIEVKTTKGKVTTPFFISSSQVLTSQSDPDIYELWRIFNFDPKKGKAKCYIFKGSLESLCSNPIKYEVIIDQK